MSEQLSLFDPRRLARRSDPATSHTAARMAEPVRSLHARLILCALATGESLTADAIADRAGITSVQVSRRVRELLDARLLVVDGLGASASGRPRSRYRRAAP